MSNENKRLSERMNRTLNGPRDPSMPQVSPFLVEDAEAEIRRSTNRHYAQVAEIEQLKNERDTWRNDATVLKTEKEQLETKLKDVEQQNENLKNNNAMLLANFETGVQIWLTSFNRLREMQHMKVVTPPALAALEHKGAEESERENE